MSRTGKQYQLVLEALQRGEQLTQRDATVRYSVGRLASRIHELHMDGWPVDVETIAVETRSGIAHVARYSMEPGAVRNGPLPAVPGIVPAIVPAGSPAWCEEHDELLAECLDRHQLELF